MSTPASPGVRLGLTPQTPQPGLTPQSNGGVRRFADARQPSSGAESIPATPHGSSGIPKSGRRDLGTRHRFLPPTPNTPNEQKASESESAGRNPQLDIWGTTINADDVRRELAKFFDTFKLPGAAESLYPRMLAEQIDNGASLLNLNCKNLHDFSPLLYRQLLTYPVDVIPLADQVLATMRARLENPNDDPEVARDIANRKAIVVRPFGIISGKNMRSLNPEDMETLVCVKGMVIRVGGVQPEMSQAFFRCSKCNHEQEVGLEDGVINEPLQCANNGCLTRSSYRLVHNRCTFTDKQLIKVQETPDSIPEGETPHSIKVYAFDDLVDFVKPGDRVDITGIYKASANKVNPRRSSLSTVYKTSLDAIHFRKTDNTRMSNEANDPSDVAADSDMGEARAPAPVYSDEGDQTAEDVVALEAKIKALSREEGIYEKLTRSLAPSIWELEDVKKGILCLLFGGSGAEQGAASGKFRGEINVLMCGDPGTSKSQLLQYVHKIAPRGIYTSGKGSSAVGLTASVVRDAESKEMVLESGALVLSDRGVCCIDEFDKMSDATRSILHEVMEQQTVSIAKAGIVCTLNARTSILASANPKESRYNPRLSVVENVQIMPTLLSRFDLIYLVLDQPNEGKDRKLAKHLVGLYFENVDGASVEDTIDMQTLTSYVSYARRTCRPVLSEAAQNMLIQFYTDMRLVGVSQKTITATPRQLEALIRLSEALARMELSNTVTEEHVHEAKRLMDVATQRAATDPTTGRIDMDLLQTGHSSGDRTEMAQLAGGLQDFMRAEGKKTFNRSALLESFNAALGAASRSHIGRTKFDDVLDDLIHEGVLKKGGPQQGPNVVVLV